MSADTTPTLYNLYCVNMHCSSSIYGKHSVQTQVTFDIENLTATHICTNCRCELYSSMDIEIEQMTVGVGVILSNKPHYNSNH